MLRYLLITMLGLSIVPGAAIAATTAAGLQLAELSEYEQQRREAQRRFLEMRERERAQKEQQDAVDKHNKAVREQNCQTAKDRYEEYRRAGGLYKYDKDGKRTYLDKEARRKAEADAKNDVKKWCGR